MPFPPATLMSLDGDDTAAQRSSAALWDQAAARLARPAPRPGLDKVFTAHLLPDGVPLPRQYDRKALSDALVQVHFPWDASGPLAETARQEIEHLYATGGEAAARSLITAIDHSVLVRRLDAGATPDLPFRNAVPFTSQQQEVEAARKSRQACEVALRTVQETAAASVTRTEQVAAALADVALGAALAEVYTEAPRYLDLPGRGRRATGADLIEGDLPPSAAVLEGPGVAGLIGALRSIHARRRVLAEVTGELARVTAQPVSSPRAAELGLEVTDAAEDLALAVLIETEQFPILHRIWRRPDVPALVTVLPAQGKDEGRASVARSGGSARERRAAGQWLADLQQAIWSALRTTARSNRAFTAKLSGSPEHVWRYSPLISRALEHMKVRDATIAFRAAEDRLSDEQSLTVLQTLNLATAGLTLAAGFTAPAPPVSLVLAVAAAALNIAEIVEDYLTRLEQQEAFDAVLDPGKAVAGEPGYLGIVVSVAFAVLDLKGVRDAYRGVRAAGAGTLALAAGEQATATTALDLVRP